MRKTKSVMVLMLISVLLVSSIITGCSNESYNETISTPDTPLHLNQIGTWDYSSFPGLEDITFDYDPEGGLFEAITVDTVNINDTDYLLLSFDPASGPGHNSRIFIFDIEDPVSPRLVSSIAHPDQERKSYIVRDVAIQDDILYAGLFGDKGLWMVDISDPTSPVDLGIAPVETNKNVLISGDYLYSSGQLYNGVIICDVSDVNNVNEIDIIDITTRDCRLAISGDLLFVGIECILTVYDISSPVNPVKLTDYELEMSGNLSTEMEWTDHTMNWSNWAHINDIQAFGDYVYITFGAGQLRIIDVSNPESPRETTTVDLGSFAISLTLKEDLLYVRESSYEKPKIQLSVFNVSEPENPRLVDSVTTEADFIFGGVSFSYCWSRPQIVDNIIFIPGMRYLNILKLE